MSGLKKQTLLEISQASDVQEAFADYLADQSERNVVYLINTIAKYTGMSCMLCNLWRREDCENNQASMRVEIQQLKGRVVTLERSLKESNNLLVFTDIMQMKANAAVLDQAPEQSLDAIRAELAKDYDEAEQSRKALVKEIDQMLGGTAEQPSLCDVAGMIQLMLNGTIPWPNQKAIEAAVVNKTKDMIMDGLISGQVTDDTFESVMRIIENNGKGQTMQKGDKYNWINQPERLVYLGTTGAWYQFALVDKPDAVWCEVLESDLHMLEKTKD